MRGPEGYRGVLQVVEGGGYRVLTTVISLMYSGLIRRGANSSLNSYVCRGGMLFTFVCVVMTFDCARRSATRHCGGHRDVATDDVAPRNTTAERATDDVQRVNMRPRQSGEPRASASAMAVE
jgi:hypothetical protein